MSVWGGRGAWLIVAKIAFSVVLLVVVLLRIPIDQLTTTLRQANPRWLIAALGLMLTSNIIGSYQWSRLLRAVDIRIPFWKVCAYYHIGLFFNNFLPANIGGDIARIADSSRYGSTKSAAVSAVIMDRLIGTFALAGLALISTLPALTHFHLALIYAALLAFFLLSAAFLWAILHPALIPALQRVLARVGLGRLAPHLGDLALRLEGFRNQPGLLLRMVLVAGVTQVSRIGVHALVARALGIMLPFQYFLLFVPLLAVIVSLPISLNGIGVREGAGVVIFGLVGVGEARAFSLQFTTYLVAVAVSLLGGLAFLLRIPRRRAGTRNQGGNAWT